MGAFKTISKIAFAVAFPIPTATYYAGKEIKKKYDEQQQEKGYLKGKEEATAKHSVKFKTVEDKLKEASKRFKEYKVYEEFILASFAIAISIAYCDGDFSLEERDEIQEIISGASYVKLPQTIRDEIQKLFINPPTFNEAIELIKRVDRSEWDVFDQIIEMIILSDGIERPEERAYKEAWKRYKSA